MTPVANVAVCAAQIGRARRRALLSGIITAAILCTLQVGTAAQKTRARGRSPGETTSKILDRATKLYDSQDYYSASIQLYKVIEGETQDTDANRQKAEFWMGKTLYNLKFYAASLSYFDKIVQQGAKHSYYNATLKWLASLARVLPESAGLLERVGKYNQADLEQPELSSVRNELYYLLGRYYYSQGNINKENFRQAVSLFQKVPVDSEVYARAKFFEGMTWVREGDGQAAAAAFKEILRKHQERPDASTAEFVEVTNLALARVFYSTGQFDISLKYFEKIPQESPDWTASLFESSWAHFQVSNYSKALGNIHTLNAPFFENEFFPESLIIKAVIYFTNCLYDKASESIAEFEQEYPPLKREIDELLAKYPENAGLSDLTNRIRKGTAGLSDRLDRAARGVLQDRTLLKQVGYVDELDRELVQVERAEPAWKSTAIAANILQELTLQKSLAVNEEGNLARQRLKRLSDEIGELDKQRLKVDVEILNAQKGQLTQELASEQESKAVAKKMPDIVYDDEHEYWPFWGEYWKDELGAYRVRIASQCKR